MSMHLHADAAGPVDHARKVVIREHNLLKRQAALYVRQQMVVHWK